MILYKMFVVCAILFNTCFILCAASFDFNSLYFIKDVTGYNGEFGKYLYYKGGDKSFGYIVNCEESTVQYESNILESITGLSSPFIKVPLKNKMISSEFNKNHVESEDHSLLRLCPVSANNKIEFYKYLNAYYVRFVNNFGSGRFSGVLIKIKSDLLIKALLNKDVISRKDCPDFDEDPAINNDIFEIKTISDYFVDPVFDVNFLYSEHYVDHMNDKIDTYVNNKNRVSVKLDLIIKTSLKNKNGEKNPSTVVHTSRDQYLFSETLLQKMGCENDLSCEYKIPFASNIAENLLVDRVESLSYENVVMLNENDVERLFNEQMKNKIAVKQSTPLKNNRDVFSIVKNTGESKYTIVVSNKKKIFGYSVSCDDKKTEDKILFSFLGDSNPRIEKNNRMNSHVFHRTFGVNPRTFLSLCPSVDVKNEISLYYDNNVYYLRFINNFGITKYSETYHAIKSTDLLKIFGLDPSKAIPISAKDIPEEDIFELEMISVPPIVVIIPEVPIKKVSAPIAVEKKIIKDIIPRNLYSTFDLRVPFVDHYFLSAEFSPDSNFVLTTEWYRSVIKLGLWDMKTKVRIPSFDNIPNISLAKMSPNGKNIVVAFEDGAIGVLNTITKSNVFDFKLKGHDAQINSIAFSSDSNYVITTSNDKIAKIWDLTSKKLINKLYEYDGFPTSAAFSPNGKYVVTVSSIETLKVWDISDGRNTVCMTVPSYHYKGFTSNVFSSDSKYIITYNNFTIRNFNATIWQITTGKAITTLAGHTDDITSAQYSPNGQTVVTTSRDRTARVWNPITGKTLGVLKHYYTVFSASYSPHGDYIITSSGDRGDRGDRSKVWDANTLESLKTLEGHSGRIVSAVYDSTGQYVLTFSDRGDQTVKIWE